MRPANSSPLPEIAGPWERLRKSCDTCQDAKVKCTQHKPSCRRCLRLRQPCVYSPQRRTGRPPKRSSPSNNPGRGAETETVIVCSRPNANIPDDHPMTDVTGVDPWVLTGDFAAGMDHADVFQSSFDALFATSMPPQDGFSQDHDERNTSNEPTNPPSIQDPFGFSFPIPDYNRLVPLPSEAPLIDPLPITTAGSETSHETADCGAKCYTSVLQQLLFLRQTLPETTTPNTRPSIDVIMQAESHVRTLLDRVLRCSSCMSNRSSVLLMSTITERIVQMLDWIIEEKTLLDTENIQSSQRSLRLPSGGTTSGRKNVCHIPLRVGSNVLDEDAKQNFLKQFILLRLKKLAAKAQEVRRATTTRPGDCIYRAAELVLTDSIQRLEYLRGQCQLWE